MSQYRLVITTTGSAESADALARSVIDARLAACAQIDGPVSSVYWWDGEATVDQEWRIMFKTTAGRYGALEAHIKATHSYDTPEIVAITLSDGSAEYLGWITEETSAG